MSATSALDAYLANAINPIPALPSQPNGHAHWGNQTQASESLAPRTNALPKPWTSQLTEAAGPIGPVTPYPAAVKPTKHAEVKAGPPACTKTGRAATAVDPTKPREVRAALSPRAKTGRAATVKLGTSKPRSAPLPRVALLGSVGHSSRSSVHGPSSGSSSRQKTARVPVPGAWPPPAGRAVRGKNMVEKGDQETAGTLACASDPSGRSLLGQCEEVRIVTCSASVTEVVCNFGLDQCTCTHARFAPSLYTMRHVLLSQNVCIIRPTHPSCPVELLCAQTIAKLEGFV
jgi:hypothetical protein